MRAIALPAALTALTLLVAWGPAPQQAPTQQPTSRSMPEPNPSKLFQQLAGRWTGTSTTYMRGKVFDASPIEGRIEAVPGGLFLQHTYAGQLKGKPRTGQETLAYDSNDRLFQSAWLDSFHMSTGLMFSTGPAKGQGFAVMGDYFAGPGQPRWGWRTEWSLAEADNLVITMFNIAPGGQEEKAVVTDYRRVKADPEPESDK